MSFSSPSHVFPSALSDLPTPSAQEPLYRHQEITFIQRRTTPALELLRIWRRGEEKDATLKAGGFHEQNATGLHQRIQAAGRRTF